jgi:hypothetical protein
MVGFLDLPEEEQNRLRAGNINDSVLIMRNKRATSNPGSSDAKGGEAAVAYYQQHMMQLQSSSDGSSCGGAEGGVRMPGQLRGRSSDGSESGKRVQFGAAQVVAVCSAAGLAPSAAGDAPAPFAAIELRATAAAAGTPAVVMDSVQPEHEAAASNVLLPGGG